MHMADALLSPAVGGVMYAVSAAAIGLSVKKIAGNIAEEGLDGGNSGGNSTCGKTALFTVKAGQKGPAAPVAPLMGVLGAFVFAGQMINFTIPGTGSSGHIGGGILLAAVLGPFPALIALASVLIIQCLFFADGGLLAYGCNVFNMGVTACLIAYPLVFKPIVSAGLSKARITAASVLAVVAGLQIGAFFVVLETLASGVTELPFGTFVLLMQPIHLAIGLVEGLVTAAVLCYVHSARPELLDCADKQSVTAPGGGGIKKILITFAVLTVLVGGGLSIFASQYPDGLEWSMEKTAGTTELEREGGVYESAAGAVERTAFMPDYGFISAGEDDDGGGALGTSAAGIVGSLITVLLAAGIGFVIYAFRKGGQKKSAAA